MLFIVLYIATSIWILQSLVLAVFYNIYRQYEDARKERHKERVKEALKEAFKELDIGNKVRGSLALAANQSDS